MFMSQHSYRRLAIAVGAVLLFSPFMSTTLTACAQTESSTVVSEVTQDANLLFAKKCQRKFQAKADAAEKFTKADSAWLRHLQDLYGRESMTITDPDNLDQTITLDCSLTPENLNSIPDSAQQLANTLNAMIAASEIDPQIFQAPQGVSFPVYNKTIFSRMRNSYTPREFADIVAMLDNHKAFAISVNNKNGLVATTELPKGENDNMSQRQWVTDTVRTGYLEKLFAPEGWRKALNTLAEFYTNPTEQAAFDKAIADPASFREGGPADGVAHIFYPATGERDPDWACNKRLESIGLALEAMVQAIEAGIPNIRHSYYSEHANPWRLMHRDSELWGLDEPSDAIIQAMANMAAYLIAIEYQSAPSCGNWEEIPFPGGLTWDSEVDRRALSALYDLLYQEYDAIPEPLQQVRERLFNAKHGEYLHNEEQMRNAIEQGRARVEKTYMAESPGHREKDASLSFSASSDCSYDNDSLQDIIKHLDLADMIESELVRENGMIRYAPFTMTFDDGSSGQSPDSYLNYNYCIACDNTGRLNPQWKIVMDRFAAKDASDPKVFLARAQFSTDRCEAQWFMVSDLAYAYTQQAFKILELERHGGDSAVLDPLLARALSGATLNINRSLGRITAEKPGIKANGKTFPCWSIPEAWQCVSNLKGEKAFLPGINTPLTWAKASLAQSAQAYYQLLKELQEMNKDGLNKGQ